MTGELLLECQGVTKKFGGLLALDNLDLSIEEGYITGLIGPNGAGKTTCFNTITGVYRPDSGSIFFHGKDITGWRPHQICRTGIARTFQTPQPLRTVSVSENLQVAKYFGRKGDQEDDSRLSVDQVLNLFNLSEKADADPSNLQIVERKSLDLARALMTAPNLILADEMMAGLNPSEKKHMSALLRTIHDDYNTDFLIIEHDLRVIRDISDQIIVINEGRHLSSGQPEHVLEVKEVQEAYIGT